MFVKSFGTCHKFPEYMVSSLPKKPLLIVTHLLALGLGTWWAWQPDETKESTIATAPETSANSTPTRYRISSERLLDALKYDSPHFQEVFPRKEYIPPLPAEERADLVTDFAGELQKHVDRFNQTGYTDYRFTQEVIARWMSVDPEEAMHFWGQVKLRSGWGDPWPALFKNPSKLDGLQLFTILNNTWLPNNRFRGMKALAPRVGELYPEQLSAIMSQLEPTPARQFFNDAVANARPGDLSVWLDTVSSLPENEQKNAWGYLAKSMVPSSVPATWLNPDARVRGPKPPSMTELQSLVSAAENTPAEALLKQRLAQLLDQYHELSTAEKPPTPTQTVTNTKPQGSPGSWLQKKNVTQFQQVFNGQLSLTSALQNQLALVENEIPAESHSEAKRQLVSEALMIDATEALAFAEATLTEKELNETLISSQTKFKHAIGPQQQAEYYSALVNTPHWDKLQSRDTRLISLIHNYHQYHAELASEWIQSLPPSVTDDLLAKKPSEELQQIIEEARSR